MSTSNFKDLVVFLHQAAGAIKHPSFKSLLQEPAKHSRFPFEATEIVHFKLAEDLHRTLNSYTRFNGRYKTSVRNYFFLSDEIMSCLLEATSQLLTELADSFPGVSVSKKDATFSVPRGKEFTTAVNELMDYDTYWARIKTLTDMNQPGDKPTSLPLNYVTDVLFQIRHFVLAMNTLQEHTGVATYERVLQYAFVERNAAYWIKAFPFDLLAHDRDSLAREDLKINSIYIKTSHVSTRFQSSGRAPADWEDGSFVEFRLNPMERAA